MLPACLWRSTFAWAPDPNQPERVRLALRVGAALVAALEHAFFARTFPRAHAAALREAARASSNGDDDEDEEGDGGGEGPGDSGATEARSL